MSKSSKDPSTTSADAKSASSTAASSTASSSTAKAAKKSKSSGSVSRSAAADELTRRTTAQKVRVTTGDNPQYWVPTMVTLMVLGLLWLVVTYLAQGQYPAPGIGVVWNLGIGFALVMAGFLMTTRWK